jgi:quinol-cytochrome oxidoreductase complex cytochrome b subunit
MKLLKRHPLLSLFNSYLVDSPAPSNLSYLWNYGSLLGLCLVIQIITGVTLAIKCVAKNLKRFAKFTVCRKIRIVYLLPSSVERWVKIS